MGIGIGDNGGGGGDSLLSGIGQLLDPLGIITGGGGSGGGLSTLLNPAAAIFGLAKGEVDKSSSQHATDEAQGLKTAKDIMGLMGSNEVQQHQEGHGTDLTGQGSSDPTQQPPTELPDASADSGRDGYDAGRDPSGTRVDQSATTGDDSSGAQVSQSAATAADGAGSADAAQQTQQKLKALEALTAYFDDLDGSPLGHTGRFDQKNLEAVFNGGDFPLDLQKAVLYLQEHPELLTDLAALSGDGGGFINRAGIQAYVDQLKGASAAQNDSPTQGGTRPTVGGDETPTNTPGGPGTDAASPYHRPNAPHVVHPNPGAPGMSPGAAPAPSWTPTPPSTSFEVALDNLSTKLNSLEARMDQLTDVVINGSEEDARKANAELTKLQRQFQTVSDLRKQMYTLLSDLEKSYHDLSMHAIGNIR